MTPRITTTVLLCILVSLVHATTPYADRHQPLTSMEPWRFVDGTRESLWKGSSSDSQTDVDVESKTEIPPPFSFEIRPTHTRPSPTEIECEDLVTVTVTTTGSVSPNETHWLASYSPALADVTKTAPTKFALLTTDAKYLETGKARLTFRLTCMRHDYDFVVFTNDWVVRQKWRQDFTPTAVAVGRSQSVTLVNARGPRAPRVVLTRTSAMHNFNFFKDGDVSHEGTADTAHDTARADGGDSRHNLAVAWSSGRNGSANPRLKWWVVRGGEGKEGEDSQREIRDYATANNTGLDETGQDLIRSRKKHLGLVHTARAVTETYARRDLCGSPANASGFRDPGWTHVAAFRDPPLGGVVQYELVDDLGGVYPAAGKERLTLFVPWALASDGPAGPAVRKLTEWASPTGLADSRVATRGKETRSSEIPTSSVSSTQKQAKYPFTIAVFGDMGRGTDDSSTTWQEYGYGLGLMFPKSGDTVRQHKTLTTFRSQSQRRRD